MPYKKPSLEWRILERAARPPEKRCWRVYFGDGPLLDKHQNIRRFSSRKAAAKAARREVKRRMYAPRVFKGSRLRLWECHCERPVKLRVGSDYLNAKCNECRALFDLVQ